MPHYCYDHQFRSLASVADRHGFALTNPSQYHYQLRGHGWIYNLYPSTGKICADPHHRGPKLQLPKRWSLQDALFAAIEAAKAKESTAKTVQTAETVLAFDDHVRQARRDDREKSASRETARAVQETPRVYLTGSLCDWWVGLRIDGGKLIVGALAVQFVIRFGKEV